MIEVKTNPKTKVIWLELDGQRSEYFIVEFQKDKILIEPETIQNLLNTLENRSLEIPF